MTKYDENYVRNEVENALGNLEKLYDSDCVKWGGTIKDSDRTYTDLVSEILLKRIDKLKNGITEIDRHDNNKSYKVKSHHVNEGANINNTNRLEENTAKKMFNHSNKYNGTYEIIGRILDYQIPLKSAMSDKAGKIDLISYNEEDKKVYLLELKRANSKETMLRAVLEAYTYSKQVKKEHLLMDFDLPNDVTIIVAPLVYKDGFAHIQYEAEKDQYLGELMNKLNVVPYFIEEIDAPKTAEDDYECKIHKCPCKFDLNNNPYMSYIDKISNLSSGLGRKGSKYWMGMTVNTRIKDVLDVKMDDSIKWVSPLKVNKYKEYRMNNKPCIEAIERIIPNIKDIDAEIWNKNGPLWDGIGISTDEKTLYLVEAKAHTSELNSSCAAKGSEVGGNLEKINDLITETYKTMADKIHKTKHCEKLPDIWTNRYYQLANRLTYVKELNKRLIGSNIKAKLVLLNFTNDYTYKKTTEEVFKKEYINIQNEMFGSPTVLDTDKDVKMIYFDVMPK